MPKSISSIYCPICDVTLKRGRRIYFKYTLYEHLFDNHNMKRNVNYLVGVLLDVLLTYDKVKHNELILKRITNYIDSYTYCKVDAVNFGDYIYILHDVNQYIKYLDNLIYFNNKKLY